MKRTQLFLPCSAKNKWLMQQISALKTEAQSAVSAALVLEAASKFIHLNLPRLNSTASITETICDKNMKIAGGSNQNGVNIRCRCWSAHGKFHYLWITLVRFKERRPNSEATRVKNSNTAKFDQFDKIEPANLGSSSMQLEAWVCET